LNRLVRILITRALPTAAHLALLIVPWIASSCASASTPEHFGLKQIFDLQWAADPRIAPNGKRVVFVRSGFDVMNDDTRHSLWVVGTDGNGCARSRRRMKTRHRRASRRTARA
jgi:Dipeptidyl aminopeptidases/acylaminoacyl-peptidases